MKQLCMLIGVLVLGCQGLGLSPRPPAVGGVTMARDTFVAPQAVLRVRWRGGNVPRTRG